MVVRQIVTITNGTLLDPFSQKLILLFGDLAQLPPVCKHRGNVCHRCNIASSAYISAGIQHNMTFSVRHASDPEFLQFLDTIRTRQPTEHEIRQVLSQCIIDNDEFLRTIDDSTTVICTHRDDVYRLNDIILRRAFSENELIKVNLNTNATNEPLLQQWLNDQTFDEIHWIAVGAKCMITSNIDPAIGAANGSTSRIQQIHHNANGQVAAIEVRLDSTGTILTLRRTKQASRVINKKWYQKTTFPLMLAYAIH